MAHGVCLDRGTNDFRMVQLLPHHLLLQYKIQSGLPFWCRLTQVVRRERPLNECTLCLKKRPTFDDLQ